MNGAIVVDVGAKDLEAARVALARAVASGAFGAGYAVRRDGDGFAFVGEGGEGPDRGRLTLSPDGRCLWELALGGLERQRVAEGVIVAVFCSVVGTLGWSLAFYVSLPTGAAIGLAYAVGRLLGDRARWRRRVRALLSSLAVLVDARG